MGVFGLLSTRELQVVRLLGGGASDREIAMRLGISSKTVSVHLVNARAKTGIATRVELAVAARRLVAPVGWIPIGHAAEGAHASQPA